MSLVHGVLAPATTPFDPVTGDVDPVALRRNLRGWIEQGVAGVVLFGSTGEGVLLEDAERELLLDAAREVVGPEQRLLVGTGAESTRATIRRCRAAGAAGADAVLVQPPAYYRPQLTPDALRDHFRAVADASPVPVLLYQIPPRFSGVELPAGLVGELAQHPNIAGIKDSSGDLRTLGALVDACGARGSVLVGSGAILYGALELGVAGGILAVALLAPRLCVALCDSFGAGEAARAGRLQELLKPLHQQVVGAFGVPGVKAALDVLGYTGGLPRGPLKPLRPREHEAMHAALAAAGLLDAAAAGG